MATSDHALLYVISGTKEDVHVTGRRVVATVIDTIVIAAAYNLFVILFGDLHHPHIWEWNGLLNHVLANVCCGIGVILYYVLMEGFLGQTVGKMLAGIAVVPESATGPPGLGRALVRTVLRIIDGMFGYAFALIAVLTTEERQRLGDMAARTLVVRVR